MTKPSRCNKWPHKRIRLYRAVYGRTGELCSVTIAVQNRRPIFAQPELAEAAMEILRAQSRKTGVVVYGYCVMPDHVHLVISPSDGCDLVSFVGQYKILVQRVGWSKGVQGTFWQKSFWDHFLRSDEPLGRVVEYVLANPVRKGMVEDWRDYPFSGSFVLDLKRWSGGRAPALLRTWSEGRGTTEF
jgi:putative transposase